MNYPRSYTIIFIILGFITSCSNPENDSELRMVLTGQALIKKDPRIRWEDPFGSIRPIIDRSDVAFTNFEMAVLSENNNCDIPDDYEVSFGTPSLSSEIRPGNTSGPHAVAPEVMGFLAEMGFNLMSLSNNHAWDLGDCGITATQEAAKSNGISFAGTGSNITEATSPGYITIGETKIALLASTTSHDKRSDIVHSVNGVWIGWQEDLDRNIEAVRSAAEKADFVLYYHHFQLDIDEFDDIAKGDTTGDGHIWVEDVAHWQSNFARAILDAGASIYVGNGYRAFDGVEIYNGKPLIRQIGGLAYQGLHPEIGYYEEHRPWEGIMAEAIIRDGRVVQLDFLPLNLDEGNEYRSDYDDLEFLSRRGLSQLATGNQASLILDRFNALSINYGSKFEISKKRAILKIE